MRQPKSTETYRRRRDVLVEGLVRCGWELTKPRATMFVWAPIPEPFRAMGSLEFAKFLLAEAKVAVSPGVGFGEDGDGFVRFGLIENEHRIRQALRGIRHAMQLGPRTRVRGGGLGSRGKNPVQAVRIGLLGCGTVGGGVVKLLRRNAAMLTAKLGARTRTRRGRRPQPQARPCAGPDRRTYHQGRPRIGRAPRY